MRNTRGKRIAILLLCGALFSLLFAAGYNAEHTGALSLRKLGRMTLALLVPFTGLLYLLFTYTGLPIRDGKSSFSAGKAALLLFLCDVPAFLVFFPGSFAYDVPFQAKQFFTGTFSTHHPLVHTLFLGGCLSLGKRFGNINIGAALYSILQMAGMAVLFARTLASIARQSSGRNARRSMLWYALYPFHMIMAVNATKDVLFAGAFAWLVALTAEVLSGRGRKKEFVAAAVLSMLLRNNAKYAFVVFLAAAILFCRSQRRTLCRLGALALAVFLLISSSLAGMLHAHSGDVVEMLSWPIQIIARICDVHEDALTEEEKTVVGGLMPEKAYLEYDQTISDPVKFAVDSKYLSTHKAECVRVLFSLIRRFPKTALNAVLKLTYPFLYPYQNYRVSGYYLQTEITEDFMSWCDFPWIRDESIFPRLRISLTWRFGAQGAMQFPVVGLLFNMGLISFVMLFYGARALYRGNRTGVLTALLPVLLWGTFLLGPCMTGRYIYPFVCCLPVLSCVSREPEKRMEE